MMRRGCLLDPGAGMPQWRLPFSCSAGFEFVTLRPFHFFFRCRPAKTSTLKSRGAWEASPCATPLHRADTLFACKLEEDRISYTVRLGIFGMVSEAGSSRSGVRFTIAKNPGEGWPNSRVERVEPPRAFSVGGTSNEPTILLILKEN